MAPTQKDVVGHETSSIDDPVNRFFVLHRDHTLTAVMKAVTLLGSVPVLMGLAVVVGVLWWIRRRRWRPLLMAVAAWGGAALLTDSIKAVIDRPRPPASGFLVSVSGSSFPSGHTLHAASFTILALSSFPELGWLLVPFSSLVAVSRVVLGLHYPSDVAAGAVCADVADGDAAGAVVARASPLRLDPTGFFKIHVAYEQGTLAADYHEAGGRHVETLAARSAEDLLAAIVGGTYVGGDDETRAQHLGYLAVQIARADFALRTGLRFEEGQGLSSEARKNVGHHLVAATVIAGESLEDTWLHGLTHLREEGLLTTTQKGRVAEAWCTLFGIPEMGAMAIPEAYPASEEHIAHYAAELLAPAPDVRARGDYTYGDRTCHYFFDQIAATGNALTADPTRVYVNQRWVPEVDLPAQAHHRPCLVFDLWFRWGGRLHTLQIARSHDVYGGLPQNALGIARGWAQALARASGLALGDLWFCSISNNFRVGDDAENVRRALRGGVHAAPHVPTLPAPRVEVVEEDACRSGGAEGPIRVRHIIDVAARPVGTADEILAATPILRERLLRYRGELDQVATVIARLRTEAEADGREHSNSLLLSPRDPRVDRSAAATPLVCLQLRRQLGRLHAAAILLGPEAPALTPTLLDLQRHIATAAAIFVGSATFIHVADPPE